MSDKETAILIDHDTKTVLVDTNVRSWASLLKARGFKEKDDPRSKPYRRFTGTIDQVVFKKAGKSIGRVQAGKNAMKILRSTQEK